MQGTTDLLPLASGLEPSGRGGPGRSPLRRLADEAGLDPEFAQKLLAFIVTEVVRHHEQIARDAQS